MTLLLAIGIPLTYVVVAFGVGVRVWFRYRGTICYSCRHRPYPSCDLPYFLTVLATLFWPLVPLFLLAYHVAKPHDLPRARRKAAALAKSIEEMEGNLGIGDGATKSHATHPHTREIRRTRS